MTHHHHWQPTTNNHYTCPDCAATAPTCNTCRRRPADTGNPTCNTCINNERHILNTIRETIHGVPNDFTHILGLKAIDYDRDKIHTGNDNARLPHGLDRTVDDWYHGPNGINTRNGLNEILTSWADRWAELRHETTGPDPITYLHTRIPWAAMTLDPEEWADYRTEIRTINTRIQALTEYPDEQRTGSDCLDCGGRLAQAWTKRNGLNDRIYCTRCRNEYTYARHALAVRQKVQDAADQRPDATIAEPDARKMFPHLAPGTIRTWIARGHLTPVGKDRHGRATYRIGDIAERAKNTGKTAA